MNKKTRILSLLLCLTLACSLFVTGTTALADDETKGSGIEVNKTAVYDEAKKEYTITLEAYATGEVTTTTVTKDIPTDIILVLDQSGSMADNIGTVSYNPYTDERGQRHTRNRDYYDCRHNGGSENLWYKLEDGTYVSVSVGIEEAASYTAITNGRNNYGGIIESYTNLYENRNNLYALKNGSYVKVSVDRSMGGTYTYKLADGTPIASSEGRTSEPTITGTDDNKLYLASVDETQTVYTYTYTNAAGETVTIGTSTGADTVYTPAFYKKTTGQGGGSRLAALTSAAKTFASSVATKAKGADGQLGTADDVDHRIAVVGYADTNSRYGANTGVFIGSTLNRYETAASGVYSTAFQDMSTETGVANVTASLNALKSSGATHTDYGLTMANGILNANTVPQGETRNRVVIVFTDGSPTDSNGFELSVANSAISTAQTIKTGGAKVYTIGIFSGADATSAGTKPDRDLGDNSSSLNAACNWFMQSVSSNNGTPQNPSYYLSAGDSTSLSNIFQQIADQISTGGSSSTLDSEAVVKDIISPYFTLPEGADESSITLKTYKYNGPSYTDANAWTENTDNAMGAEATVDGKNVSVTGFNFSENWCGTESQTGTTGAVTYRGNKLVISFTVKQESNFLGGNNVPTNTGAGVYENKDAQTPIATFNQPKVNVPINTVTVEAADKNVYLLDNVTLADIKSGATVKVGGVTLDLSKANYGLTADDIAYVNIEVAFKDENGNVTTDYTALKDDVKYSVTVTVSPAEAAENTSSGTPATAQTGTDGATINVFKPVLTYKDSEAYYGAEYKAIDNLTETEWKHGDTASTAVTMIGTEPTLDYTYTVPADATTTDNKINTTSDIPVKATVKIGDTDVTEYTTFDHTCDITGCTWTTPTTGGDPAFLIHVKTCSLTIEKKGAQAIDGDQSFLFTVTGDNGYSGKVAVKGNGTVKITGLKVGTYTVTEDEGWSWRYTASGEGSATLSAENPNGSVTIANTRDVPEWLSGEAYAQNKFETTKTADTGDKTELPSGGSVQEN